MREKEKTTVPIPSVGADGEQSLSYVSNEIIATESEEINPIVENMEEILRQMQRMAEPSYLPTMTMSQLYDTVYESRLPVIDGLLYPGTYLFVGAPKVGKSFLMAQIAYHVSTGQALWNYPVHAGTVLYLALEDDYRRLQERLSRMFGVEGTDTLHFATCAKQLGAGLHEQLNRFVSEHQDTRLIIIDSATYDHSKTFLSDVTRTTIGIHLYRDNETDPWRGETSGVPTAEYSHTLLNKDVLSEWEYDDEQILAGYHPTVQEYWLYICDQKTGIVNYETRIIESDPVMQFKESIPQTGEPISPQPGDTTATWNPERASTYPDDSDCTNLQLLEKWLAVEGLTFEDLDERNCDQLILVSTQDDGVQTITVCYQRQESGKWVSAEHLGRMNGFTGANGIAHNRRRNTNTSPAGLWALGTAFGNADKPNGIRMPWRDVTPNSDWVCDANSIYFNTWQERDDSTLIAGWDYGDVEHLEDYVTQYAYAVVIEYNTPPYTIPDRGCAIFLHCSKGATGGCIGLNETDMVDTLLWLDPECNPHILITGYQKG